MPFINQILEEINNIVSDDSLLIVGGALRDRLLKKNTRDIDLITLKNTQSLADQISRRFNGKSFIIDRDRNTVRIVLKENIQIDIARYQGNTLEEDLKKRDFRINSMAITMGGWLHPRWSSKLIDPNKGLKDLKAKKISLVSTSALTEDPLRLLRAFRFSAEHNLTIDGPTLTAIRKKSSLIKKCAPERIREEFLKLFSTPHSYPQICLMEKAGLLSKLLPEIKSMKKVAPRYYGKGGVWTHTVDSLFHLEQILHSLSSWFRGSHKKIQAYLDEELGGFPRRAHLKWGVLLHDFGKPATAKIRDGRLRFFEHEHVGAKLVSDMSDRFRWSNHETQHYSSLVKNHMRPGNLAQQPHVSEKAIHRFFRDLGPEGIGMLLVSLGDHLSYLTPRQLKTRNSAHEKLTQRMVRLYFHKADRICPPKIINGHDIIKQFNIKPSPLIGELLNAVVEAQSEGKIKTKDQAMGFIKKILPNFDA